MIEIMATYAGKFNYGSQDLPIGATLYGTCDTAAATAAKVATLENFDYLMTGVTVHIKFANSNTVDNPTLKVGSTDAKSIKRYGTTSPGTDLKTSWNAGSIVSFTYDGTYWIMDGWLNSEGSVDIDDTLTQPGEAADAKAVGDEISDVKNTLNSEIATRQTYVRPNLLDNWYFVGGGSQQGGEQFPINQRGQTVYSGVGYGIDRFYVESASSITVNADYVNFSGTTAQYISLAKLNELVWKTVTFSALDKNLGLKSVTGVVQPYRTETKILVDFGGNRVCGVWFFASGYLQICRIQGNTTGLNLIAVKLELGSTQTLAHNEGTEANPVWVLNEIPDYGEQLYRCCASTVDPSDSYANIPYNVQAAYAVPEDLTSQLTASVYVSSIGNSNCFRVGRIVICNININVPSAAPQNATLISGFPTPSSNVYTVGSIGASGDAVRLRIMGTSLQLDGTYSNTGYINALLVYTI